MKSSNDGKGIKKGREHSREHHHHTELRLAIEVGDRIVCHSYPLPHRPSWQHFEQFLRTKLGLNNITVKYRDEEGDEVSLSSEEEFTEILNVYEKLASVLLLHVEPVETDLPGKSSPASGLVDADGFPKQATDGNGNSATTTTASSLADEEPAGLLITADCSGRIVKDMSRRADASLEEDETSGVGSATAQAGDFVNGAGSKNSILTIKPLPKKRQVPPEWFTSYMEKFKGDVTAEITKKVIHRMQKLMLRSASNSVNPKNEAEGDNAFGNFRDVEKGDEHQQQAIPTPPPLPLGGIKKTSTIVHPGVICDNCNRNIIGVRYKCGNCVKFDLCEKCESLKGVHENHHVFVKMRYPSTVAGMRKKTGKIGPLLKHILYDYDVSNAHKSPEHEDASEVSRKNGKGTEDDERERDFIKLNSSLAPHDLVFASREKKMLKRLERQALKLEKYREKYRHRFADRSSWDQVLGGLTGGGNGNGFHVFRHHHGHHHHHHHGGAGFGGSGGRSGSRGHQANLAASAAAASSEARGFNNVGEDSGRSSDEPGLPDGAIQGFNPFTIDLVGAKFIFDETIPDNTEVAPGARFTKKWRILNTGNKPWTEDTVLKCIDSDGLHPFQREASVPHLLPNEEGVMSVDLIAPTVPGSYTSHWRLTHQNIPFGHKMWCSVIVAPPQLVNLAPEPDRTKGILPSTEATRPDVQPERIEKLQLVKQEPENGEQVPDILRAGVSDDASKAVALKMAAAAAVDGTVGGDGGKCWRDLKQDDMTCDGVSLNVQNFSLVVPQIASSTATPNNTPLDLTPPKSPEIPEDSSQILDDDDVGDCESCNPNNNGIFDDDDKDVSFLSEDSEFGGSMVSLSSTDSDLGYVMVPLPPCFNFTVPAAMCNPTMTGTQTEDGLAFQHRARQNDGVNEIDDGGCEPCTAPVTPTTDCKEENSSVTTATDTDEETSATVALDVPLEVKSSLTIGPDVTAVAKSCEKSAGENGNGSRVSPPPCPPPPEIPLMPVVPLGLPETEEEGDNHNRVPDVVGPERVLATLPENLMSVAATIFNSARDILTDMHKSKTNADSHQNKPQNQNQVVDSPPAAVSPPSTSFLFLTQLQEMGFYDRERNAFLIDKHNGDMTRIVAELLQDTDNNWHEHRH